MSIQRYFREVDWRLNVEGFGAHKTNTADFFGVLSVRFIPHDTIEQCILVRNLSHFAVWKSVVSAVKRSEFTVLLSAPSLHLLSRSLSLIIRPSIPPRTTSPTVGCFWWSHRVLSRVRTSRSSGGRVISFHHDPKYPLCLQRNKAPAGVRCQLE